MSETKRGVAICHWNRLEYLEEIVEAVKTTTPGNTRIVICDDGSDAFYPNASSQNPHTIGIGDITNTVSEIAERQEVLLVQGPNKGVAANKNRALWALQDCHLLAILEDDLIPRDKGWFEAYEAAALLSGIHHFCRVQDKEVPETIPAFSAFMNEAGLTPIYATSPRGDLTFLTSTVVQRVGAFNPMFRGAGYAHGEWSHRVNKAGLINHPQPWIDIKEARDKIEQIGDTQGGRWQGGEDEKVKRQLKRNRQVLDELRRRDYTYHDLVIE